MVTLKKSIEDLADSAYANKRVLVREDLNVPMNLDGTIASDFRIQQSLPTLRYLVSRKAKVIVVSHMGRPKNGPDASLSLKPVAEHLQKLLPETKIHFCSATSGTQAEQAASKLQAGEILLLENIRFEAGETKNDEALSKSLATLCDIYVNDAFGAAHRAHSSTEGVAHLVPTKIAGLLMAKELSSLTWILNNPAHPFVAIVGGSKVSSKIEVLNKLLQQVDTLVIGGGMVFTFLKAQGFPVGKSLVEDDHLETAKGLLKLAEVLSKKVILPTDIVAADKFAPDAKTQVVSAHKIPADWMGLDIGPESIKQIKELLKDTKTVFWNGPLGVFEMPLFAEGTRDTAQTIANLTKSGGLKSVLGGGDTQAAIDQFGISPDAFTHVSTGGGATLELMEGKVLPGVAILDDKATNPVTV